MEINIQLRNKKQLIRQKLIMLINYTQNDLTKIKPDLSMLVKTFDNEPELDYTREFRTFKKMYNCGLFQNLDEAKPQLELILNSLNPYHFKKKEKITYN